MDLLVLLPRVGQAVPLEGLPPVEGAVGQMVMGPIRRALERHAASALQAIGAVGATVLLGTHPVDEAEARKARAPAPWA